MRYRTVLRTTWPLTIFVMLGCERSAGKLEVPPSPQVTTIQTATPSAQTASTPNHPVSSDDRVPVEQAKTLGHIRVQIKKSSIALVPLKQVDGSISYSESPCLMISLRIENTDSKKSSGYNTWVPDLESAKTVARLVDDQGLEINRLTFGFGNNVKDRTVLDTLSPGKAIGDVLVFASPAAGIKYLDLDLPGANCGVKGMFRFRIPGDAIVSAKTP